MTDPARELGLLRAIAADLEAYLKSDIVYWSLTGAGSYRNHYPQLTLGGLLLAQAKLAAVGGALKPQGQTELAQARQEIAGTRARWRANWLRKAEIEARTRVNAWGRTVREMNPADYPAAAQSRLMLELLLADVQDEAAAGLAQQRARLATLDTLLRHKFEAGRFIMEDDLQPAFPRDPYWFLYGRPKGT
jgi:hypothetical protein